MLSEGRAAYDCELEHVEREAAEASWQRQAAAEATARASRQRQREADIAEDLRKHAAAMAEELKRAQTPRTRATAQRPATARDACYYISSTGGGICYHLTPTCSGLRQAGVTRVSSTMGRRLCKTCASMNEKPLVRAPSASLASARRVYYTTRTGKKYHADRCCNGLRNAKQLFEATSRPLNLEACSVCCGR